VVNRFNGRMPQRSSDRSGSVVRGCMNNNVSQGNGCGSANGCGTAVSGDCKAMLRRLQLVEFGLVDTGLYLNIYPDCKAALSYYNKLLEERRSLVNSLSVKCKRPMTAMDSADTEAWNWISSPWPWEPSAN